MLGGSCPKNVGAIYIRHSNGVHYDIVLDVLSDTKPTQSNCSGSKRKIGEQASDSEL
jgi:hypothetical protein